MIHSKSSLGFKNFALIAVFIGLLVLETATAKEDAPTIQKVSINGVEQLNFDLLNFISDIDYQKARILPPSDIPEITIEADERLLNAYSTSLDTNYIRKDYDPHDSRPQSGFEAMIYLDSESRARAWPNIDPESTYFVMAWIVPNNKKGKVAANLMYPTESTKNYYILLKDFEVPSATHPNGASEPEGYPAVLAYSQGQFLLPTAKSQAYRFSPPPSSETDAELVSFGLHFAVQNGFTDYVRDFVDQFPQGKSPITKAFIEEYTDTAARCGRSDLLEYLISLGANVQKNRPTLSRKPFYQVINKDQTIRDVFRPTSNGMATATNLIFTSLRRGQSACVLTMLESLDHQPKKSIRNSVVFRAIDTGNFELAEILLELGYPYKVPGKFVRKRQIDKCSNLGYSELAQSLKQDS